MASNIAMKPASYTAEAADTAVPRVAHTHEKYERLIAHTKDIPAIRTAVVWPCEEHALAGAVDAGAEEIIAPVLVGAAKRIRAVAQKAGLDTQRLHDPRCRDRGGGGGGRGASGPRRQGARPDEGQPAHRRADARGRRQGRWATHGTADQPRLCTRRADLSRDSVRHRRRDQHLPRSRDEARHRAKRDRPACRPRARRAACSDPVGG